MPSTRLNIVVLAMAGLLLPLMFIPFSTMATPTVSQEPKASPAASNPDPSMPSNSTAVDIAFGLLFFILFMVFAWIGGWWPFPPLSVVVDHLRTSYRLFVVTVSRFRLDSLFQSVANVIIGNYDASPQAGSAADGGGTSPSTPAASQQRPEQNQQPDEGTATHDHANTAGIHHDQACPTSV